jgi:hypothetical protein
MPGPGPVLPADSKPGGKWSASGVPLRSVGIGARAVGGAGYMDSRQGNDVPFTRWSRVSAETLWLPSELKVHWNSALRVASTQLHHAL